MELLILFIIGLLIVIFILPFVALAKANTAKRGVDDLVTRLSSLENEVRSLRRQTVPVPKSEAVEAITPPLPTTISAPVVEEKKSVPPPISQKIAEATVPQTARPAKPSMDWEQFMGAKMFAWIGGFALFLGVAFFVKYSFEHNLSSPDFRLRLGFLTASRRLLVAWPWKARETGSPRKPCCRTAVVRLKPVTSAGAH